MTEAKPSKQSLALGVCVWFLSLQCVIGGVWFGANYVRGRNMGQAGVNDPVVIASLLNWDGHHYESIVNNGYTYDPDFASDVAFFPAYPVVVAILHRVTGLHVDWLLVVTSNVCLLAALIVFTGYVGTSSSVDGNGGSESQRQSLTVLTMGLWPVGLFFRMAYSESLFLLVSLVAMLGMKRDWPLWRIAAMVGLGTACRSVGVALIPVFLMHIYYTKSLAGGLLLRLRYAFGLLPIAMWGLLGYMCFLYCEFGDPLVFAKTQDHFFPRSAQPFWERIVSLLTAEPIWSVYVPGNMAYWAQSQSDPFFTFRFANPVFFVLTAIVVLWGARRNWLNRYEVVFALTLLLIPYIVHAYQFLMMSEGRFTSVVFPLYIVLGRVIHKTPTPLQEFFFATIAVFLFAYSALFAAHYLVI